MKIKTSTAVRSTKITRWGWEEPLFVGCERNPPQLTSVIRLDNESKNENLINQKRFRKYFETYGLEIFSGSFLRVKKNFGNVNFESKFQLVLKKFNFKNFLVTAILVFNSVLGVTEDFS